MKNTLRKAAATGAALSLCLGVLTGCGNKAAATPTQEDLAQATEYVEALVQALEEDTELLDEYADEEFEDYYDDAEGDEEYYDDAEGDTDLTIGEGYYGFWDGDTEYIFGVSSDGSFMINIVDASSPLLYAEGTLKNVGGADFEASITYSDNDFASGQTFSVYLENDNSLSISGGSADMQGIVTGSYYYAGTSAEAVDQLK